MASSEFSHHLKLCSALSRLWDVGDLMTEGWADDGEFSVVGEVRVGRWRDGGGS